MEPRRYNFGWQAESLKRPGAVGIFMIKRNVPRQITVFVGSEEKSVTKNETYTWFTYLVDFKKNKGMRLEYFSEEDGDILEDVGRKLTNFHPLDAAELISKGLHMTEFHDHMEDENDYSNMRHYVNVNEGGKDKKHFGAEVGFPTFRPFKSIRRSDITWTHVKATCAAVDFVLMQIALLYKERVEKAGGLVPGEVPAISTLRWVLTADVQDKLLQKDKLREAAKTWHRQLLHLHYFSKSIAEVDNLEDPSDNFYTRDAARVTRLLHQDGSWDKYDGLRDWRREDYPHHLHPNRVFEGEDLRLPTDPPPLPVWGTTPNGESDETLTLEKPAPEGEDQSVHRLAVLLRRLNTDKALNEQFFINVYEGGLIWDSEDVNDALSPKQVGELAQFFGVLNMCQAPAARPMDVDAADVSGDEEMGEGSSAS